MSTTKLVICSRCDRLEPRPQDTFDVVERVPRLRFDVVGEHVPARVQGRDAREPEDVAVPNTVREPEGLVLQDTVGGYDLLGHNHLRRVRQWRGFIAWSRARSAAR